MNLEELRSVRRAERQKDSLQHLRDSFYRDVADYIVQLKDERERAVEAADDPFSSEEVRKLTDRIESTTEIANALYERRVGKVVKHASFAAADMATDEDGMTTEERDLFDDLVARIRANRETVLATLDGNRESASSGAETAADPSESPVESHVDQNAEASPERTETPAAEPSETTDSDPTPSPPPEAMGDETGDLLADALGETADAPDAQSPPPEESATGSPRGDGGVATAATGDDPSGRAENPVPTDETNDDTHEADVAAATAGPSTASQSSDSESDAGPERVTLRITKDVPSFYGIDDRDYDLAPEDVVTLPTTNAEPLIQKNAAERID